MAISTPGLGSGLDVNSIITQLMALERQPINVLNGKEAAYQAKLSAYGSVKSAMSSFQSTMASLASTAKFSAYSAYSSNATMVGVSVTGSPSPGTYTLEVTSLAQAQKLAAAGQASATATIGNGESTTLTFDFGTITGGTFTEATGLYSDATFTSSGTGSKTVTIEGATTLTGIRDAINSAKIGVTASIVNDGGATPYRLVLSSDGTGADKSVKLSVDGDAAIESLLAHDPEGTQNLSETVTAKNALFEVDGIAISKPANIVTDAIPGVSLTLLQATAATPVKITVSQDKSQITTSVNSFVKAYNDLNKTLTDLSAYNATTKQGAILNGDATVRSLQSQMRSVFGTALTGVSGAYTTLSQIGVAFQKDGTLAVDNGKLQKAIADNPDSVSALFAATGKASDALATYGGATAATKPGAYALTVDSLATQGVLTGSAAAALTITAGVNDEIGVKIDGVSASVKLTAGTYTASQLASHVQSAVNGASALSAAGVSVSVSESGGVLTFKSARYGSASEVVVTGGSGAADLVGGTPAGTPGADIAGTINGAPASGSGHTLTGVKGNDAEGLKFAIAGGDTGTRGTLYYSTGFAYRLEALAASFLGTEGALESRTEGINKSIEDIGDRREALARRMASIEQRLRAQFTALDTLMSSMTRTSSFLQQQLANLPKIES